MKKSFKGSLKSYKGKRVWKFQQRFLLTLFNLKVISEVYYRKAQF